MSEMVPEFREHAGNENEHVDSSDTPVIAQYTTGAEHRVVRNEVRGTVRGAVIQIAGDHHGGIRL